MQHDAGWCRYRAFPQFSTVQQINFSNSNVRQMRFPRKVGGLNNIGMKVCVFVGFLKQYGGCMGAAWGLQTISHNSQLQLDSRQEHGVNKDQRAPIKNDQNWNHLKSETLDRQQHRNVAVYLVEIAHTCEKWVAQGREKTLKSSPLLHVEQTLGDFMLNILNLEAQTTRNTWWFLVKNP